MELIETLSIFLALAVALASAAVGMFNPKPNSFGAKLIKLLNIISVINPKSVKIVPREKTDEQID